MGEWWRSFFPEGWAEALALVFDPETTAAQVDGIERLLELAPGARVLDVPCGNGRMTFPLAEQGYRTTGVDFTQAFLADARGRALDAGVEVEFVERDMRDPWTDEFDGAFCYGGSFGYFDDAGNVGFLRAVALRARGGRDRTESERGPHVHVPRAGGDLRRSRFHRSRSLRGHDGEAVTARLRQGALPGPRPLLTRGATILLPTASLSRKTAHVGDESVSKAHGRQGSRLRYKP